jgi:pSer/pThr/pTyr-binding forkhead associated (FHA) protein
MTNPIMLRDLGSTNGTWVKGFKISEMELKGDVDITLGDSVIQFRFR